MSSESRVLLLGPQRFRQTLGAAVRSLGVDGRVATVTAGWQEREGDDQELHYHLDGRSINLRLYQRAEEIFRRDPEFARGHSERQDQLKEMQEFYGLRLAHAMQAVIDLYRDDRSDHVVEAEREDAIEAVRELDRRHLERVRALHAEYEQRYRPWERDAIVQERQKLAEILAWTPVVAIAGGHVAVLLNRLRLLDLAGLLRGQPVIAWSAGAMAISDRVVLFHDTPPQGAGHAEVLDSGIGLAKGIVPLPHAWRRLRLDDPDRVLRFSRRFAPAQCVALDDGCCLEQAGSAWAGGEGCRVLAPDGSLAPIPRDAGEEAGIAGRDAHGVGGGGSSSGRGGTAR